METVSTDPLRQKLQEWQQQKGRAQAQRLPWIPRFRKPKAEDPTTNVEANAKKQLKNDENPIKAASANAAVKKVTTTNKENDDRLNVIDSIFRKMDLESNRDSEAINRAARRAEYSKLLRQKLKEQSKKRKMVSLNSDKSSGVISTSVKNESQNIVVHKRPTVIFKSKTSTLPKMKQSSKAASGTPSTVDSNQMLQPKQDNAANVLVQKNECTPKPLKDVPYYLIKQKTPSMTPYKSVNFSSRKSVFDISSVRQSSTTSTPYRKSVDFELTRSEAKNLKTLSIQSTPKPVDLHGVECCETAFEEIADKETENCKRKEKSRKSVSFFVPCADWSGESFELQGGDNLRNINRETYDADSLRLNLSNISEDLISEGAKSFAGHTPRYTKNMEQDLAIDDKLQSHPDDLLTRYLKQLVSGHSYDEISSKLDLLCAEVPSVQQLAKYWFCRSQLAMQMGDVNEALRLFEVALTHRAEVTEELHPDVLDLQERISKSSKKSGDPCIKNENIFESSTVKLCITTPHKSISSVAAYTVTPVRRSARFVPECDKVDYNSESDLQLPVYVDSMQQLPSSVRKSILLKQNPALTDWNIDVEYDVVVVNNFKKLSFRHQLDHCINICYHHLMVFVILLIFVICNLMHQIN